MRTAPTDDTIRIGPLAAPAGAGPDGSGTDPGAETDYEQARTDRAAIARDLGAIACAVLAVAIGLLSLYALGGWPIVGLAVAALLGAAARQLGYLDPTARYLD